MKKYIVLCVALVSLLGTNLAQPPGAAAKKEKIESMKIAFITQKLNLSPEEAQKFWPVYNKYTDEQEKARKAFRGQMMEELQNIDEMTNAEADKALNDMLAFRTSEVDITRKYTAEFKKVLPSQKVVKLFVAEQEFKKELLKMLRQQKGR